MPDILVRKEMETDLRYGHDPLKRPMELHLQYGVVVVDKPSGPTSHQVSAYAKAILGLQKAGHSGTLDPAVTGVLPIALEKATRIVQTLLPAGKEYVALMHIHDDVAEEKVRETMARFIGTITQMPPIRSAVKRQERQRNIYSLVIDEIDGRDVLFHAEVQAGTYIRKLCSDIGIALGSGAHMAELRRTRAGPFTESKAVTLQDLADAFHYWKAEGEENFLRGLIHPVEEAIPTIPKVYVFDTTVDSLAHGAPLGVPGIAKMESGIEKGTQTAVMTLKGELICLGTAAMSSEEMRGERGIAVKVHKVFMDPGIYPKMEKEI